jgi:predicted transcriptional regulator
MEIAGKNHHVTKSFRNMSLSQIEKRLNVSKPVPPKPTNSELSILRVLWDTGPATVREVHDVLNRERDMGYTTVLKLMQIMTEKGLLERDEESRSHIYKPCQPVQDVQRELVADLLQRAFGGSPVEMANALFETEQLTKSEFEKLRKEILAKKQQEDDHE